MPLVTSAELPDDRSFEERLADGMLPRLMHYPEPVRALFKAALMEGGTWNFELHMCRMALRPHQPQFGEKFSKDLQKRMRAAGFFRSSFWWCWGRR